MSDVTLTFVANDQGVIQSLARQEAAINASIGRMNNRFASVGNKFVGPGAVGGFLGGLGIGSAFAIASKMFDGYARSSEQARDEVDRLTKATEVLFSTMGTPTVGPAVTALTDLVDGLGKGAFALFGAYGLVNRDIFDDIFTGLNRGAELDRWAEKTKRGMDAAAAATAKYAAQVRAVDAAMTKLATAQAEYDNRDNEFRRRRAVAFVEFRAEEKRLDGLGPEANTDEVRALRETNRLRLENTLAAADRGEVDAEKRRREQDDNERWDYERRVKAEREDASLQRASLNVLTLRTAGKNAEADAAERELQLRTRLLDIEKMQYLRYEERMGLIEASTRLFEAQTEEAIRAAGVVHGGRGVDSGLASAAGVVRGSLVATARDNPAALQRRSNELLERIARAVEDGTAATFAP